MLTDRVGARIWGRSLDGRGRSDRRGPDRATIIVAVIWTSRPSTRLCLRTSLLVTQEQDMIRVTMDAHAWTGDRVGSFVRQDVRLCISSPFFWSLKVIVTVSQSKISGELFDVSRCRTCLYPQSRSFVLREPETSRYSQLCIA
jgi:hypothetical protein